MDGRPYRLWAALWAMVFWGQASALPLDLGMAGDFNAFVLGDMTGHRSDVEGRLAVGGDLTLSHYAVGMQLSDSNGSRDDLIVGGELTFSDGRVYGGNARSGAEARLERVGFYDDSAIGEPNGTYRPGVALDFAAAKRELTGRSRHWAGLSANGTVTSRWGGDVVSLEGNDPWLNVFNLSGELLEGVARLDIDAPLEALVLINVDGLGGELSGFGIHRNGLRPAEPPDRHDGSLTQGVMFNFFEARELSLHAIGIKGSLLAPLADVTFYDGHIDGTLVAGSLGGHARLPGGQFNHYPWQGEGGGLQTLTALTTVPGPPSLWLLSVGLVLLVRRRGPGRL